MKISVCIITYNQEQYIDACLQGAVSQQVNCEYEIVIGEDLSTDGTLDICKKYAAAYPDLIKLISGPVNVGMTKNGLRTFAACTGDYLAICEGDDFWTDPHKLQRQLDFMEANPEYSMVAENGLVIDTIKNTEYPFNNIEERDLEIHHLLSTRQFPTASVLLRRSMLDASLFDYKFTADTFLWCFLARKGKIRYLPIISSVYRKGMQGIVKSTDKLEWAMMMEKWNNDIAKILPKGFDTEVLKRRNFTEYLKAFFYCLHKRDFKKASVSLKKCFQYQPVKTTQALSKYILRKMMISSKA
jgi:glycosyltransferase involved in cell wall biosynthesis